jgi:hypothetical protein
MKMSTLGSWVGPDVKGFKVHTKGAFADKVALARLYMESFYNRPLIRFQCNIHSKNDNLVAHSQRDVNYF